MVEDSAFSHKIDCVNLNWEILNLEGHLICITGSRVTVILLNGWILPVGGASAVEGLQSLGLPRLVFETCKSLRNIFLYPTNMLLYSVLRDFQGSPYKIEALR